tara:strand:+ start:1962 stop:2429 length:468 start_codon:yes stop_codon:yes gene_type:complete
MAHFAQLNDDNIVINVIRINDEDLKKKEWWDPLGLFTGKKELEHLGVSLCQDLFNDKSSKWKRTCKQTQNGKHYLGGTPFRKNFAGLGMIYDEERDAFYYPCPHKSWRFNESTCWFVAPDPYPCKLDPYDLNFYEWDEERMGWVIFKRVDKKKPK